MTDSPRARLDCRGTVHHCKDCNKRFVSWNPDSMRWYPVMIQYRYAREIWFGRKTAIAFSMVQRALRDCPRGLQLDSFAAEYNERQVRRWRSCNTVHLTQFE